MRRPLSAFQQAILGIDALRPGVISPDFVMTIVVRLRGPVDVAALDAAFDDLIARHELLRTNLVRGVDGEPDRAEVQPHRPVALEAADPAFSDDELFATWRRSPIDPAGSPLVRGFRCGRGDDEHLVGLVLSHLAADPRTMYLACGELGVLYGARVRGEELPPPEMQYGDYATWQAEQLADRAAADLEAWRSLVAGLEAPSYRRDVEFVPGAAVAAIETEFPVLTAGEFRALSTWSLRNRTTPFTTLLALFLRANRPHADTDDLVVTTVFERRDHPATRAMLGPFIYPALIRVNVDGAVPLPEFVASLHPVAKDAYDRCQTSAADVAMMAPALLPSMLGLEPAWMRFFQYVPTDSNEYEFGDATATIAYESGGADPRDLMGIHLSLSQGAAGDLIGKFSYDTNDVSEATADEVIDRFRELARELVASTTTPHQKD